MNEIYAEEKISREGGGDGEITSKRMFENDLCEGHSAYCALCVTCKCQSEPAYCMPRIHL